MTFSRRAVWVLALASVLGAVPARPAEAQAPRYEVDPAWPRPLPELWVLGGLGGVCVDAEDHVLILNRQDVIEGDLNAARLAPPVIEFDPTGEVVHSWGDLDDLDPRLHSCHFGPDGNVWIASAPSGMVRQYTHDGARLLSQIGEKGVLDSSDGTERGVPLNSPAARFFAPASVVVDRETGDVYVADGESEGGNLRVKVFDRDGLFLRQWQPEGMTSVHCLAMARDGTVYVCNRLGSRIQAYDRMGSPRGVIEIPWQPVTPPDVGDPGQVGGSAVAIDFSPDPAQQWLFVINQNNARVEIVERATGAIVGSFGRAGSYPGQFDQAHGIAVDSEGNVYVAENRGRRVHKFRPVGD